MRHFPRLYAAIMTFLFLSIPGVSQIDQEMNLSGELQSTSETLLHGYVVALEEVVSHRDFAHTDAETDGAFHFRHIPYGTYLLKVQDYYGDIVQQTYITVDARTTPIAVSVPKPSGGRPPSGGVSAASLQHPPAKKAIHAFVAAQKFSQSGRYADAARELERALEISPDYAQAHSNLAAQYVRLGRYEDAVTQISRAIEIAKPNALDLSNLACAQSAMQHFDDAIQSARAALRLEPANPNAHFILGSLLARDRRSLPEGISHLEIAAESNPAARPNLERAQAAMAHTTQAP